VIVARNELHRDESGAIRARDTGERETIECGLVLRSIGYRGVGLAGVPFDERRGVIPNEGGRAIDPETSDPVPGQYATGWIKRGPSGVIGTNKKDSNETVEALFADLEVGRLPEPAMAADRSAIVELLAERQPDAVSYQGWEAIDRAERELGEPRGRPRIKFCTIEEMLEASRAGAAVAAE
jgi:ferredoxin/flavodoxin---NADP+ reductase